MHHRGVPQQATTFTMEHILAAGRTTQPETRQAPLLKRSHFLRTQQPAQQCSVVSAPTLTSTGSPPSGVTTTRPFSTYAVSAHVGTQVGVAGRQQ